MEGRGWGIGYGGWAGRPNGVMGLKTICGRREEQRGDEIRGQD
jgi:hypothetical protein